MKFTMASVIGLTLGLWPQVASATLSCYPLTEIERALDAQRRFVADASHELRTPVAIIRADAEVLQREGHVSAEGQPLAADIVDESERLGRLVGDLLAPGDLGGAFLDARLELLAPDLTLRDVPGYLDDAGYLAVLVHG